MPARAMLLAGTGEHDLTKLAAYRAVGGYAQVPKARAMTPDALIAELQASTLRGRGGAGFPIGRKASLIDRGSVKPKYLVVNADESEPGAFKDRQVMGEVPHRLIEGCLIAAHAIESRDVFIYIRGEYLHEYEVLQAAVDEARVAGLFPPGGGGAGGGGGPGRARGALGRRRTPPPAGPGRPTAGGGAGGRGGPAGAPAPPPPPPRLPRRYRASGTRPRRSTTSAQSR